MPADYNLVIPSVLVALFQEAFSEYTRAGGAEKFDPWALKALGQALLPFLQDAQFYALSEAFKSIP